MPAKVRVRVTGAEGPPWPPHREVNRALGRTGKVWADRYHARALTKPREVRNALVYVLNNVKKHRPGFRGLDVCSSAPWFTGWRRHGLIAVEERPRSPG